MDKFKPENILKVKKLESEMELEQATDLFNKLRLLEQANPNTKSIRIHLANLIEDYEIEHWRSIETLTSQQITESEHAENSIQRQNQFIQLRKKLIRKALKENGLLQQDLADILSHGKGYTSELINGVRPLSQDDVLIINKVLGIELKNLIIPILKEPKLRRVQSILKEKKRHNPKLKIADTELEST